MTQVHSDCVCPTVSRRKKRLTIALGGLCAIALCVAVRYYWGGRTAHADPPGNEARPSRGMANPAPLDSARAPSGREEAPPPRSAAAEHVGGLSVPVVAATVNAQRITRDDLARECLHQYGKDVLESMVNRQLILQECQRRNLAVTEKEVDAEIDRMAKRFGIPVDKWLKLLQQERNITPSQYAHDIVWPTLALRKLAGERLKVSDEEKAKEFETMYGEAVRARLIAVSNLDKANQLQAQAAANPAEFGDLAKKSSEDAPSAAAKGIIQPIRRHGSYKEIEDAVFHMTDGQVSKVIPVGGQYVIIKREGLIPAKKVSFEEVAPKLEEVVRDSKMRGVAQDVFKQLQDNARVDLVWADPAKHARMPDVAALINGVQITVRDLAQECIERHGLEVLEGMINRKLLEEACRKRNIAVSEEEIQQEIAREAVAGMKPKEDGAPDIAGWMAVITKKRGISADMYRNNVVWPTAVLKKLVQDKVEVNEEDLKKGYEANFGPRVRCLAIVLNNERSAQRVFDLARKNNTRVYFGTLASQYSVEPSSQSLRGEVPPIKMNGGQPVLEKEAFALQPGELSGVISVDDKFVILRCEEFIKPAQIEFAKVRDDLRQDVFQKKLHLAMADFFERLQESAAIDNFLAGTSQSPNQHRGDAKSPAGAAGRSAAPLSSRPSGQVPARSSSGAVPILRQVPGG